MLLINDNLDAFLSIYSDLEKQIEDFETRLEKKQNLNEFNIIMAEFYFNFNCEKIEKENIDEFIDLLSDVSINTKKSLSEQNDDYKRSFETGYIRF